MAKYKSFKNTKRKLNSIWQDLNKVQSEVENDLKKFIIRFAPEHFTKKITIIPIATRLDLNPPPTDSGGGIGG